MYVCVFMVCVCVLCRVLNYSGDVVIVFNSLMYMHMCMLMYVCNSFIINKRLGFCDYPTTLSRAELYP